MGVCMRPHITVYILSFHLPQLVRRSRRCLQRVLIKHKANFYICNMHDGNKDSCDKIFAGSIQ